MGVKHQFTYLYLLACQVRVHPLVEFMHLVFTRMSSESTSSGGIYASCVKTLLACQVRVHRLMVFMHLVFTRIPGESTSSGGVYAPCIYSHAK